MTSKGDGIVRRIDRELYKTLQDLSIKNNISIRQASKDAATALKQMNGRKLAKEVRF
jgi:hypothetical protein